MRDAANRNRVRERADKGFLADQLIEIAGAVFAG